MKKFKNILIISDIDGTLVDETWKVSKENITAARYFMDNGGTFTYATGRQAKVTQGIVSQLMPNAPVICYNGAAIYDFSKNEYLWISAMDDGVEFAINDILKNCDIVNLEINTPDRMCSLKDIDATVPRYEKFLPFFTKVDCPQSVERPWLKIVIVCESKKMPSVRSYIESQPYYKNYQFSQSASFLYEFLTPGVNKGSALNQFKKLLDKDYKIIALGDNENDIDLIRSADIGFAVASSSKFLLDNCSNITVSMKDHALADIIEKLDKGLI